MKTLFKLKNKPEFHYIVADQAREYYFDYLRLCNMYYRRGYEFNLMWLNFEQYLAHMKFIIF